MAKKLKTAGPESLTMSLGAPGMSPLHRAGLGGLAATLRVIDRLRKKMDSEHPITPFDKKSAWNDEFSWEVTPTTVTFHFGKPENAAAFFQWLFTFAFQIQDEMIFLPGQYKVEGGALKIPPLEVRARLQQGITLTFLQHGQTRKLEKEKKNLCYDVDKKKVSVEYKECSSYTHQSAWKEWVNDKGELDMKTYSVQGPIYPGAVVRHIAYTSATLIAQPVELIVPLLFALVGTLSLPISGGVGVLLIPHVEDIVVFAKNRSFVTPMSYRETNIVSLGDAALQFEIRRYAGKVELGKEQQFSGCDTVRFRPMPWSTQQKSRSETLSVEQIPSETRTFYDRILGYLPSRLAEIKKMVKEGKGKEAKTEEKVEYFWAHSVVRALIADNLAQNQFCFTGFARLMTANDPASNKPLYQKINFEREGLNQMINDEKLDWKLDGARPLVLAVQESLRRLYGKVASAKGISTGGLQNRLEGEYDKWRLAFSGAKTPEQFRFALTDMFSRAKSVPSVQENWSLIMPLVIRDWQLARDLALVGLAGYKGEKKEGETPIAETTSN